MAGTNAVFQITLYRFLYLIKELNMNKKLLCVALLGGLGVAQVAFAQDAAPAQDPMATPAPQETTPPPAPDTMAAPAQDTAPAPQDTMEAPAPEMTSADFDDRWYVTGDIGYNYQDTSRDTENAMFATFGIGKFINRNWSLDGQLNWQNPKQNDNEDLAGASTASRSTCVATSSPKAAAGIRTSDGPGLPVERRRIRRTSRTRIPRASAKTATSPPSSASACRAISAASTSARNWRCASTSTATLSMHRRCRTRQTPTSPTCWLRSAVVIPLGPEPMAPVAPAPVAPSCADTDDDGDGVNNCDDKCPGSQAGQTIGPDGCPVPVSIDLKGVNFDFDKSTLRPDAVAILNEAIEILKRYPDLKVEVAGHTDSVGSDAYNQKLSERRAKAVYDYLTSNGVDAARLVGPNGYGESRPIAPNTNPDGSGQSGRPRANRRTELNVQNQ